MTELHSLLARQLKKHLGNPGWNQIAAVPEDLQAFVAAVNAAYVEQDSDRSLLARSLEISSEELLRANSEMRAIFQAFPDLFFRLSMDGRVLDCKAGGAEDLYLPREQLLGKRIQDVPQPAVGESFAHALREVREQRSMVSLEYELERNGQPVYYEARVLPLLSDQIIAIVRNITARKQAEETIRHYAYHDYLTGLPNRRLLFDHLELALAQAQRQEQIVGLFFLDLDRFKTINDSLGHAAGDRLLIEVARRLHGRKRAADTLARLGGDEFLLLVTNLRRAEDAGRVAESMFDALRPSLTLDGHRLYVTASAGISLFPHDGQNAETLVKNADLALYRAKELGRNNYQIFTPEMNAQAIRRLMFESQLRQALEQGGLEIYYQPQIDSWTGRIVGLEALVRWRQANGQLVLPGEFIRLAEETGLILPLGEWVLRTACAQARGWEQEQLRPVRLSVNLSAVQFRRQGFVATVAAILAETGFDPLKLVLELTESAVMEDPEDGIRILRELRAMGIGIALDDFGTGHSSLSYLKRLPLTTVKIDQTFIQDAWQGRDNGAIVKAIIAMAHSLGMTVVAEGVERQEQVAFLRTSGCDEIQGFYFSPPLSEVRMRQLLQEDGET